MTSSIDFLTFTVPLTSANRAQAQQLAQQMPHPDKATEVERNLLAVLATQYYLQLLGLSSDLTASRSWDLLCQWTGNPSDLVVANGHLHCCPIAPGQIVISLPDINDGLGHVVVQLSDDLHEAKMLGFAPATEKQITRNQLQSLDTLIDCLTATPVERLHNWFENKMSDAWDSLENILNTQRRPDILMASLADEGVQPNYRTSRLSETQEFYKTLGRPMPTEDELANDLGRLIQRLENDEQRWQAAELLWELVPDHPASPVILAKDIGLYLSGYAIGLEIGLLPRRQEQFLVLARIRSIGQSPILPSGLQFTGQDEHGNPFFSLSSRSNDRYVQFKFNASLGDAFSLIAQLDDAQIVEGFVI